MSGALIDKAFKLFNDKKYKAALESFDALVKDEETPSWIKSRVEKYRTMANRALAGPQEPEMGGVLVSFHINLGEYDKAQELLGQIEMAETEKAFFQAQIHIEQERREEAIESLKVALGNQDNRGYAINSPSFAPFLKDDDFLFLREHEEEAEAEA